MFLKLLRLVLMAQETVDFDKCAMCIQKECECCHFYVKCSMNINQVFFRSLMSLLILFCLVVLPNAERGRLKSPTMIVKLSISPFSSANVLFHDFEALLLVCTHLRLLCLPAELSFWSLWSMSPFILGLLWDLYCLIPIWPL